jgi:hypothetical protein
MSRFSKGDHAAIETAAWSAALARDSFGYAEIATDLKINMEWATSIVRGWVTNRLLEPMPLGQHRRKMWRILPGTVRPASPKGRTGPDNMWTAMRGLTSFTPSVIAANATVDPVIVTVAEAQAYCRALLASEHLRVVRKAAPPHTEAIYRLVRNTGPRAPVPKRVMAIIDANVEQTIVIGGNS